ncbi:hypothetical protein C0J52_09638 [Blattella germanica]|nr:hypothetical protein C0J52_09638 [Blattella germanica]
MLIGKISPLDGTWCTVFNLYGLKPHPTAWATYVSRHNLIRRADDRNNVHLDDNKPTGSAVLN